MIINKNIMSGFEHESLGEDYELNKVLKKALGDREPEFKEFLKQLAKEHKNYDDTIHPLGMYREERDKGTNQEKVHKFWLDKFGLDTGKMGIASAIASALIDAKHDINDTPEYKDTLDYDDSDRLPADEKFKINLFYEWDAAKKNFFGDYDEDDPIRSMSFREFLQDKLDSGDYEDNHEKQLIQDAIKEVTGGKGYFREMMATQMADMGQFNKFSSKKKLKLEEDGNGKTAVVAFGRFNPPHIGHRKLARAMKNAAKGGEAKLYLGHTVDSVTDPLSYESKLRWARKELGDLVDVVDSDLRSAFEVLHELWEQGYTDIIYAGGADRIKKGSKDNMFDRLVASNGKVSNKTGEMIYNFNSITPLNAGERDPDSSDVEEQASASLLRKLAIENNFEEFKKYVYLDEKDAQAIFKELRHAMMGKEESFLEACNKRIEELLRV